MVKYGTGVEAAQLRQTLRNVKGKEFKTLATPYFVFLVSAPS